MVETRSKKKLNRLYKQPITSIANDTTATTTTTQYSSTEVESSSISKDRLSELPDEILVHILSFLEIEEAVGTLLLQRFGNLWTLLPTLELSGCSLKFITNVMKYHRNPTIDRWVVAEPEFELEDLSKNTMRKCVDIALRKKPKFFGIDFSYFCCRLESRRIFISQFIVTLRLSNCLMDLPCLVNMGSLKRLELLFVEMVEEDMKVLEVGCPCLQELFIVCPCRLKALHFTAPNIERLEIRYDIESDELYSLDCPNLKFLLIDEVCLDYLELIDVSSVCHARIKNYSSDITVHRFELLHKKFQNAKVFHLKDQNSGLRVKRGNFYYLLSGDRVCMQLEQCGNEKLAFQKNDWSVLVLKSGLQRSCLLNILRLLRNSRYLEELILYVNVEFFCDCNMPLQELSSPCEMRYLKSVTIRDFEKPCKSLVQLTEFVLKSAVVLENLVIVCNNEDQLGSSKGVKFILELLSLPRASKNARVVVA